MHIGDQTVAELGEDSLLARIVPTMPAGQTLVGNGDDAAVLPTISGSVIACADILVQDRHFRTEWSTGADVGWRATMANLSDISAMGGRATHVLVSLVLPTTTPVDWVDDLALGVAEACAAGREAWGHPVGVAGGDLSSGREIAVAVTALGTLDGGRPLTRSGAQIGDTLALGGTLGMSAAGLALGKDGTIPREEGPAADAWRVFRRPAPPLALGRAAAAAGATAAMDISDGLGRDALRLARASGVHVQIGMARPSAALVEVARLLDVPDAVAQAAQWWRSGGEDHALLATFPQGNELPAGFTPIGAVTDVADGGRVSFAEASDGSLGWDHFAGVEEG
ncbi:MAG: thiamine-phosphate kinase [Bowdeniella nasicola]|nr:thiamine-phosphate kinase [Bowdeniella nasicola]